MMAVNPDKVVMTSALVTVGSTVAFSAAPEKLGGRGELPHPRLLIGAGLTFFGLSILADFAPKIAAPLAGSIALTALTYYGMPIIECYIDPATCRNKKRLDTIGKKLDKNDTDFPLLVNDFPLK